MLRILRLSLVLLAALTLLAGCSFGAKQLKDGRQAYNEAVRISSDQELLLNIVRLRYLDTIEFLGTNSISAQLSFSMTLTRALPTSFGFSFVAQGNESSPKKRVQISPKMSF